MVSLWTNFLGMFLVYIFFGWMLVLHSKYASFLHYRLRCSLVRNKPHYKSKVTKHILIQGATVILIMSIKKICFLLLPLLFSPLWSSQEAYMVCLMIQDRIYTNHQMQFWHCQQRATFSFVNKVYRIVFI